MRAQERNTPTGLLIAVVVSAVAIFTADLLVPLGVAVWVLYFAPIALSKFAWRPSTPLLTAAACSVFLATKYFLFAHGQESLTAYYSPFNRSFGLLTMWAAAFIGRQFILSRLSVHREDWYKAAQTSLSTRMQGEQTHAELGESVLSFLAEYVGAQVGAIYMVDDQGVYQRTAAYALDPEANSPKSVRLGEGLVGQVAQDNRLVLLSDVPDHYSDVQTGTGSHRPRHLVLAPAESDGRVRAVLEFGFSGGVDAKALDLFGRISGSIAAAVRSANYRVRQNELLEETQRQAEQLQAQQEELRVQNEELEQQSRVLQESQARLETQQSELEQLNLQLAEHARTVERERNDLRRAQAELTKANEYKSEFLANMSHELRTPLNSSLILAKLLLDNREGNLTPEQVKFAQTIYTAGNDLLTLINDILDLSKIEAGKLEVRPENIALQRLLDDLENTFRPISVEKRLDFAIELDQGLPGWVHTDSTRLQQILRNLLSNAMKFTERGGVSLRVRRAGEGRLAFDVRDTGIGIAPEQHEIIFEAFRQADGTTNRKYGGTGLGLSISRDLARLLGGELTLESARGRGSTFTLTLPETYAAEVLEAAPPGRRPTLPPPPVSVPRSTPASKPSPAADDREQLAPGSRAILIIEDDASFRQVLHDLAHELEFKALVAGTAEEGLAMAERYRPSAIILDVGLPDRSGLTVLDALKHNPATRHIPVHVISGSDYTQAALQMGAAGYALKPVEREAIMEAIRRLEAKFTQKLRRILVVEDDDVLRESTCHLLSGNDVQCVSVGTAAEALTELRNQTFDCMVLDLSLPDRTGFELLEEMSQTDNCAFPPVIVYTGRSLTREEEQQLRRYSSSIIVKGARSPERLLDEATLFLHQVEHELPPDRQRMLRDARHREAVFEGRRVLIVEDDVRNIFALSSALEPKGALIEIARNGREAIEHLQTKPGVDLVLMDIMMPEMDGLQAMREIRKDPENAKLPIIALTAKAMADDRDNCLAAGANDYIAKPLDVDKLLSLARVWMPK